MNRIICARDLAVRDHAPSVRTWLQLRSQAMVEARAYRNAWDGVRMSIEHQVRAFVNHNRWLAECPFCHSFEYVDDAERVFFCTRCGNNDSGIALPVIFPDEQAQIEAALLARPVVLGQGVSIVEQNLYGQNERHWAPGVPVDALKGE